MEFFSRFAFEVADGPDDAMRNSRAATRILATVLSLLFTGCAQDGTPSTSTGPAILIEGALVLDGTGAEGVVTDVRVRDARIEAVGELSASTGDLVIDATGLVLAPGFIDTHSHHDRGLLDNRDALAALSQGITTIVVGQDGGSRFPLSDFFAELEATPATVNVASYVGHAAVRTAVLGDDYRRSATASEV